MTTPPTDAIRKVIDFYANNAYYISSNGNQNLHAAAELEALLDALKEAEQWKAIATQYDQAFEMYLKGPETDVRWDIDEAFDKAHKAFKSVSLLDRSVSDIPVENKGDTK